jgi:ribA/ribD-fused uncharacterized protein
MAIDRFRGEHYYMSNMYPLTVPLLSREGIAVPTSEHLYQATKFANIDQRAAVLQAETGFKAKKVASKLVNAGAELTPDWHDKRIDYMRQIITLKFVANPVIGNLLVATGAQQIIEGNRWGDNFWGESPAGSGNGQNWMGKILMETRAILACGAESPILS